jgi:hypothetical protein
MRQHGPQPGCKMSQSLSINNFQLVQAGLVLLNAGPAIGRLGRAEQCTAATPRRTRVRTLIECAGALNGARRECEAQKQVLVAMHDDILHVHEENCHSGARMHSCAGLERYSFIAHAFHDQIPLSTGPDTLISQSHVCSHIPLVSTSFAIVVAFGAILEGPSADCPSGCQTDR